MAFWKSSNSGSSASISANSSALGNYVLKTGDTMTGGLEITANGGLKVGTIGTTGTNR